MNLMKMMAAGSGDKRPSPCATSIMGAVVNRSVTVGMITAVCVAGMAIAAVVPAEFGGRWHSDGKNLTLDVSRCGNGWCGVEVTNRATCGRTVLRLDDGEHDSGSMSFSGSLQLALGSEPYGVRTVLQRRGDALALIITGHTGGRFQFARRTFDFQAEFVRVDNSTCPPDVKVS